jgi:hypothetical protein
LGDATRVLLQLVDGFGGGGGGLFTVAKTSANSHWSVLESGVYYFFIYKVDSGRDLNILIFTIKDL